MQFKRIIYTCGIYNLNENDGRFSFFCHALYMQNKIFSRSVSMCVCIEFCVVMSFIARGRNTAQTKMSHHLRRLFPFHLSVVSRDCCTLPASGRIIHVIAFAHTTFLFFFHFQFTKITNKTKHTKTQKKQQRRRSVSIFAVIIQRDRQCTAYKILLNSLLSTLYYFRMHSSNTNQTKRCKSLTMCTRSSDRIFVFVEPKFKQNETQTHLYIFKTTTQTFTLYDEFDIFLRDNLPHLYLCLC